MFKKVFGICLVLAVALCAFSVSAADHEALVLDFSADETWTFMDTNTGASYTTENGALKFTMGAQGQFNGVLYEGQQCKDFTAEFKVTYPTNTEAGGIPTAFFAYHATGAEALNDLYLLTLTQNVAAAPGKLFVKNIGISQGRAGYWAIPVKDVPFDVSEGVLNGTVALKVKFVMEGRVGKVYIGEGDGEYGAEPVTTLACNADGIGMVDEIPGVDYTHLDIADALDVAGKFGFYVNGQGANDAGKVITFSDVKITCTDGGAADEGEGEGEGEDSPATGVATSVAALIVLAGSTVALTASKKRAK